MKKGGKKKKKNSRHVHTPADEFVRLDRAETEKQHAPLRTHPASLWSSFLQLWTNRVLARPSHHRGVTEPTLYTC